ncbi:hypothetical protein YC2023_107220 [Brassica napus]
MFCNWLPFVLCSRDGTGVQPYKPPLPSASTPPAFHLLVPPHRNGRTRTCRPCFACSTVGVALGTVPASFYSLWSAVNLMVVN